MSIANSEFIANIRFAANNLYYKDTKDSVPTPTPTPPPNRGECLLDVEGLSRWVHF